MSNPAETVAPLLIVGTMTLLAISTLTSEVKFYTRLVKMKDRTIGAPLFTILSVELACTACKQEASPRNVSTCSTWFLAGKVPKDM